MFKRNQRKSDSDLRGRRSLDAIRTLAQARSSEQIPRHPPLPGTPETMATSPDTPTSPSTFSSPRLKSSHRFHLLRARNASDPALGLRARQTSPPPPMPALPHQAPPPSIITTSPTNDIILNTSVNTPLVKRSSTMRFWKKTEDKSDGSRPFLRHGQAASDPAVSRSSLSTRRLRSGPSRTNSSLRHSRVTFDEPERPQTLSAIPSAPPPYDESGSTLPLPTPRLSESSRSTASSGEQTIAYSTTTTTHTTTTTTFFRLPRRKRKDPAPLFPLPNKTNDTIIALTPDDGGNLSPDAHRHSMHSCRSSTGSPRPSQQQDERPASTYLAASSFNIAGHGIPMLRTDSTRSSGSTPSSPQRTVSTRGRSHTMSSLTDGRTMNGKHPLGALLGRIRRDSESAWGSASRGPSPQPALPPAGSSAAASRDIFIPERNDEDTPPAYLAKLFDAISKPMVASLLSKNGDPFHMAVLKAYMETFDFENDPMDMAVRRLLMVVELPGEAQQISRVIDAFADRYHHCNPFIYRDADEAGIISFSLIMLHTDFFNKNNKYKMQKAEYIRNTSRSIKQGGISDDILECFYANITYTPFIRVEDEYDINGEKIVPHRPRKGLFHRSVNVYDGRKLKEPIDPYPLIIDHNLDLLRCGLKDVIQFEDPYSFTGTVSRLDMAALHRAASRSGILQIVSARSRPDAFMSQATMDNPEGADPGVVEIKVTKIGILWRKDLKRKKARSPWQEWGAILTGSQLYFFRNVSWVKSLMNQYEQHQKNGGIGPVVFKPQLDEFKADVKISTDDCVALLDKSYKKHKNAFAFIRHGGVQEYFIADSEPEMNDWLHNLNYAATFRTAGVRVRGVVGGNYEGQRIRAMKRLDSVTSSASDNNSNSVQIPTGEVSVVRGNIDSNLLAEITAARREIILQRIVESDDRIAECNRELQQHLRNGRHLSILCPIQPRARESVMMAAATLAAKIRWVRVEMWKLQCHRNILLYDMEEERKSGIDIPKRGAPIPLGNAPASSPSQVQPSLEVTPTQQTISQATNDDLQRVSTTHSIPRSDRDRGRSTHSITSPRSPSASSRTNNNPSIITTTTTADDHPHRSISRRSLTPTVSESSWNPSASDLDDPIPTTSTSKQKPTKDDTPPTTKERERSKLRRSLQRTLRATTTSDSHGHKRKHSASTMSQVPDDEDKRRDDGGAGGDGEQQHHVEGLPRKEGSFTVHGKKASVVTFGSEWQNMSNEERLMGRHRVVEDDAGRAEGEGLAVVGMGQGQGGGSRRGSYVAAEELGEVRERGDGGGW